MDESIHLPSKWADWTLTESLGSGSYGTVWSAHKEGYPEETAAVKIIRIPSNESEENALSYEYPDLHDRTSYCENLVQSVLGEIHTMELLKDNDHVVRIYDYSLEHVEGSMEWTVFLLMELLTPLKDYLLTHPMDEQEVLRLGEEMCSAMESCEQKGILHRDIKPENILVSPDGTFKIGDFGVARQIGDASLNMSLRGTFTYMAPEIYHGEAYDSQADQYSLGLVLYRFLNHNRDPFIDPDTKMVFYKDREEALRKRMGGQELPAPADASPETAKVILKCCAYRKEDRYQSFERCKEALRECRIGRKQGNKTQHPEPREVRPERAELTKTKAKRSDSAKNGRKPVRRKWLIPVILLLLVLAAGAGTFLYMNRYAMMSEEQMVKKGLLSDSVLWGSFSMESEPYSDNYMDVKTDQGTWNVSDMPCFFSVLPGLDKNLMLLGFKDRFDHTYYLFGSGKIRGGDVLQIGKADSSISPLLYSRQYRKDYPDGSADEVIRDLEGRNDDASVVGMLEDTLEYDLSFGEYGGRKYGPVYLERIGSSSRAFYQNVLCSGEKHSCKISGMLSGPVWSGNLKGVFVSRTENGEDNEVQIAFTDGGASVDASVEELNNYEGTCRLSYQGIQKEYNGRTEIFEDTGDKYLYLINCCPYGFVTYDRSTGKYTYYQDYDSAWEAATE